MAYRPFRRTRREQQPASRPRAARPLNLEYLEDRSLPSTIVWTNRGSDANDSDGFNAVFGAQADQARGAVDSALLAWQSVIADFHFADGSNTFNIQVDMDPATLDNSAYAVTGSSVDALGKPTAGEVWLGVGSDGRGAGYYLSPDGLTAADFQSTLVNLYAIDATPGGPAENLTDLFSIVVLETTHALGLNSDPNEAFQQNANGYLMNTNQPDAVSTPGTLFTFTGPDVSALFTSDDGGTTDTGVALHTALPDNSYTNPQTGAVYDGSVDSDNAQFQAGRRLAPSLTDALVLKDAYGYDVNTPQEFADPGSSAPTPPPTWSGWNLTQEGHVREISSAADAAGTVHVFGIGDDGQVWTQASDGAGGWTPWTLTQPGEVLHLSAVRGANGNAQVFAIGFDNQVYTETSDAAGNWSPWALTQDGQVLALAAVAGANGQPQVFAIGLDHQVYATASDASSHWSPWALTQEGQVLALSAAVDVAGLPEVYVVGVDSQVYAESPDGVGGWNPWALAQSGAVQSVQVVADAGENIQVFALGLDNQVYLTNATASGDAWNPWTLTQAGVVQSLSVTNANGSLHVFTIGQDGQVYNETLG